jgi:hypothetical protein
LRITSDSLLESDIVFRGVRSGRTFEGSILFKVICGESFFAGVVQAVRFIYDLWRVPEYIHDKT